MRPFPILPVVSNWPFQRWLQGENTSDDPNGIKEILKIEQFLTKLQDQQLKNWLLDQHPQTLVEAAKLSDQFIATNRNYSLKYDADFRNRPNPYQNRLGFQSAQHHILNNRLESDNIWRLKTEYSNGNRGQNLNQQANFRNSQNVGN